MPLIWRGRVRVRVVSWCGLMLQTVTRTGPARQQQQATRRREKWVSPPLHCPAPGTRRNTAGPGSEHKVGSPDWRQPRDLQTMDKYLGLNLVVSSEQFIFIFYLCILQNGSRAPGRPKLVVRNNPNKNTQTCIVRQRGRRRALEHDPWFRKMHLQ